MSQQQENKGLKLSADATHDPVDGYEPIPTWLIGIFGVLLAWGGWYVGSYAAHFNWIHLDAAPEITGAATQPAEDPIALGKRLFLGNCVSCHQSNAQGQPGQYPPLAGSDWVNGNPAWIKRVVINGLEGPITVNGQQYNNAMPAFGGKFTDKQVAAVISYVRTNAEWGNNGGPVSIESVAATRAAIKGRTAPWSASELQAINADEGPTAPSTGPSTGQAAPAAATQQGQSPTTTPAVDPQQTPPEQAIPQPTQPTKAAPAAPV